MNPPATTRKLQTAEVRREAVLDAARDHFARQGYWGTPTAGIATSAGISQAYLFRLYPTKLELFIACVGQCFDAVREEFRRAAAPFAGDTDAMLDAMGERYHQMMVDRTMLLVQLQSYAAAGEPEICEAVRRGYGDLVEMVRATTGAPDDRISSFFATGLLVTVSVALGIHELDAPWARALMSFGDDPGC